MKLTQIAKEISQLEDMPNDDSFYEVSIYVAMDLYNLDDDTATKVADIIQDKFL